MYPRACSRVPKHDRIEMMFAAMHVSGCGPITDKRILYLGVSLGCRLSSTSLADSAEGVGPGDTPATLHGVVFEIFGRDHPGGSSACP